MTWYETFDSVFWLTTITIITGVLGLSFKYCLKSNCNDVSCCWGAMEIHRNTVNGIELTDSKINKELEDINNEIDEIKSEII